ncbi:hypothetical protein FNV2029 [Fusobacterium vincentii ATCC 49256]|uniref:Uncharacterized protein n=1 Tax=Fusobacterium vincentii ATCC 49256 TaxID=209882 RepID=Q7P7Z9_FUSVC|nr:hypothetical protein FNV2029 [Fusobacterium vincentii ATCC 49256]
MMKLLPGSKKAVYIRVSLLEELELWLAKKWKNFNEIWVKNLGLKLALEGKLLHQFRKNLMKYKLKEIKRF